MIMGQTKLIHEHYDRKPWLSIVAGILVLIPLITRVIDDDFSVASIILFALTAIPLVLILIINMISRNKPSIVVYNDRLVVRVPSVSYKTDEITYSDIRNMAMESGQLLIWQDDQSSPMCCNLGANIRNAEETYDILRSAYDKYNQEHNITPAQVENLPKRNKGMAVLLTVMIMTGILMLIFLKHR